MKTKSNRVSHYLRSALLLTAGLAISGCSSFAEPSCEVPEDVANVRSKQGISVPEGLDGLNADKALKIPTATTPPIEPGSCLDEPPKYE